MISTRAVDWLPQSRKQVPDIRTIRYGDIRRFFRCRDPTRGPRHPSAWHPAPDRKPSRSDASLRPPSGKYHQMPGWEESDALVRHDLAGASQAETERHIVIEHGHRRPLRPFERARLAFRLRHTENDPFADDAQEQVYIELRERTGRTLNMCGRHLSRLPRARYAGMEVRCAL